MDFTCIYPSTLGDIELASNGEALIGLWFKGQKYFMASFPKFTTEGSDENIFNRGSEKVISRKPVVRV